MTHAHRYADVARSVIRHAALWFATMTAADKKMPTFTLGDWYMTFNRSMNIILKSIEGGTLTEAFAEAARLIAYLTYFLAHCSTPALNEPVEFRLNTPACTPDVRAYADQLTATIGADLAASKPTADLTT